MRFVLLVEGATEKRALSGFLKRWLDKRLSKPVGIQVVKSEGWSELVRDTPAVADVYLEDPDVIAVIAILDLYGLDFYPPDRVTIAERYRWAKAMLEEKVQHRRFRQFFAVHETEAWLLSDPQIFPTEVRPIVASKSNKPEAGNFDEPPSKLLQQSYHQKTRRDYRKVTDGQDLFAKLDPEIAYQKCPYLREMLDEMLALAKAALEKESKQ